MQLILKLLKALFSVYGFVIFLVLMFLIFPFVVIVSFFGKIKGGNMIYSLCRFWADAALFSWGIKHTNIYEAPKSTNHAVVFVFNHISYIDIPLLLKVFRKQPIRVLGKAEMGKIPIFGYIYNRAAVTVRRDNGEARAKSVQALKSMLAQNISIVLAPEGTFNTTHQPLKSFYDGAFKIAIETQTSIQPVLFLDAYDRLSYKSIFSLTPGKSRAVFLEEISVDEYDLSDVEELKAKVYSIMEAALIRNKVSWIQENEPKGK